MIGIVRLALGLLLAALTAGAQAQPAAADSAKVDQQTLDYRLVPRHIAEDTWIIEGAVEC